MSKIAFSFRMSEKQSDRLTELAEFYAEEDAQLRGAELAPTNRTAAIQRAVAVELLRARARQAAKAKPK